MRKSTVYMHVKLLGLLHKYDKNDVYIFFTLSLKKSRK